MSQKNEILEILKDGHWHSSFELIGKVYHNPGPSSARLGARIWDLKQQGAMIKGKQDEENRTKYWYKLTFAFPKDNRGNSRLF